jgi:omega-6 fatty acid desaturase (delta-12 desaturase)
VNARITRAVAAGGLAGRGIPAADAAWPTKAQVLSAIPKACYQKSTAQSLAYAWGSLAATLACGWAGTAIPLQWAFAPAWLLYAAATGTAATGCWVVAHECGHGAFCDQKWLQTAVGFAFHSAMLVPYFAWQRSHAVHHLYTNHVTEGETHVPPLVGTAHAHAALAAQTQLGAVPYGAASAATHLLLGWPLYLAKGSSGGPKYGKTSHFWPWHLPGSSVRVAGGKELFPTPQHKRRVLFSDLGMLAMLGGLVAWAATAGVAPVLLLYGFPLVVVNGWLVCYTWLQHTGAKRHTRTRAGLRGAKPLSSPTTTTYVFLSIVFTFALSISFTPLSYLFLPMYSILDVDVAHFDETDHTWVKGAFQTIDRPYGALLNLLHHNIGSTHVAHHVCAALPHYHAKQATRALQAAFPEHYLSDPTPVPQALWRVAQKCVAVEKLPGKQGAYIFVES